MTLDLDKMLDRIRARQWALADFDWDAPGADRITDEQRPSLRAFMADLVWIEQVGARGFAALSRQAEDPTLAEIYRWFHAEEQRHANAELALMRRWGMLDDGRTPRPNTNIRLVIGWLDRFGDDLPLRVLGTVIPLLEVALDGALLKFLLDEVHDPLCHEVFERINNDESRHLAVDFHVLGLLGQQSDGTTTWASVRELLNPGTLAAVPIGLPLFTKMRDNLVGMGLAPERLEAAIERFGQLAAREPGAANNPSYRRLTYGTPKLFEEGHWINALAEVLVALTDRIPPAALGEPPSWIDQLTWEPVA
jgi:hypothetical protein